ncbi:hypothetical protein SAMD00023353_5000620 [Rosellinia necatrix]|uniref:2EXR domain-containing protein n=1 Tax=Rosellinia necatrix TaxID=77044 RepID=A0A1W2TQ76_ROSNE|nr:hypothetical protein SAMD00023353_5000620 [Rosellinia necatrix]
MPSNRPQPNGIYHELPATLSPFVSSILALMHLCSQRESPYHQFPKIVGVTMEQPSSLASTAQEATSFTKFGQLPPELRIKIWEFALPGARVVMVNSPYARQEWAPNSLDEALPQVLDEETWQSTTQIPALLHVNSESRHEALKHYSLSFGVGGAQPRIYIDFDRDTLFFGDAELRPECSSLWARTKDLEKVQRLAIVPEGAWRALRWKKVDLRFLQKLIFVHGFENAKPGHLPQLVEDEQSEAELSLGLELGQRIQELGASMMESQFRLEDPKQRMQAARDEFNTLKMVLPTEWEKEPAVSTAVFRESREVGGISVC